MGREPAGASELAASLQGKGYRMRNAADLDPLFDQVGDARYVLLGEASHGTAEFYTWRAAHSQEGLFLAWNIRDHHMTETLDTTRALHPLRDVPARSQADVPETYPSGV